MARELLYEESATSQRSARDEKLYKVFQVVAVILFILAGIVFFTIFMNILPVLLSGDTSGAEIALGLVMWILFFLLFAGSGTVFWLIKNRFNVSYDYIFVQDELRITKVFNGKKRKYIATVRGDQILKLGWCDRDSYTDTLRGLNGKKAKIMTPNREPSEGKEMIYILVSGSIEKSLFVLECREEMMEYLVFAAGRNKLEQR